MRYVSYTRTTSCFAFDEIPEGVIGLQNDHKMVYKIAGWDEDSTYRIIGTVYPENRLVEFKLGNATLIADEEFVDPEVGLRY